MLKRESKAPLMTPWALQTPGLLRSQHLSQCVVISCLLSTVLSRVGNVSLFLKKITFYYLI